MPTNRTSNKEIRDRVEWRVLVFFSFPYPFITSRVDGDDERSSEWRDLRLYMVMRARYYPAAVCFDTHEPNPYRKSRHLMTVSAPSKDKKLNLSSPPPPRFHESQLSYDATTTHGSPYPHSKLLVQLV